MSTDRQRLQAAIRRIAKQDPELSALIGASKNKGGQASSTGVGVSDAERDNLCCDGTEGAGANAGTDQRDPDQGGEDGLDDTDPADLTMGQGSLTDITDCATGEPICFDGSGFIPPEGWDDPNNPPLDETHIDGIYYKYNVFDGGTLIESGTVQSCAQVQSALEPHWYDLCNIEPGTTLGDCSNPPATPGFSCPAGSGSSSAFECSTDHDPICDEPPPTLDAWPEDGCVNLAIYGGKIVGSKFDPENDGSYSAPRDELEVCDSSGNRILLRGSPTGGWKSIKALSGDIDPETGNGYLYRPNGQRVRQISPSEFRDDTV